MNTLQFLEPNNDQEWDNYVLSLDNYSFLNSSMRFNYLKSSNLNAFRYIVLNNNEFVGMINGQVGNSRIFGKFLECKHSPLLKTQDKDVWNEVLDFCKSLAIQNSCFMFRVSPLYESNTSLEDVYKADGFRTSPTHNIDALISQYFDLHLSEEELRHGMTDSTRNNINKLTKNPDISVKVFDDNSQFEIFREFHEQTKKIKGYVDKPSESLLRELQIQVDSGNCYMIVGYFKDRPISVWQCTRYGKYLHVYQAGSDVEFREKNIRVTYLLFWEAVKLGKSLNLDILDLFGGMVPQNYTGTKHPWRGVSAFKESLGGRKVTYLHSRDFAINKPKYLLYFIYSFIRTTLKGYTIKW